jgi:YVTN family beta-propeller protein
MLLQDSLRGNLDGGSADQNLPYGDGQVVETSNAGITVYTRTGGKLSGPKGLNGFFNSALSSGDPRILFDHNAKRFMAVAYVCMPTQGTCGFPEGIRLAVSQTDDATGNWWVYDVADETPQTSNRLDDQPRIGISDDKIIVTWDEIDPGGGPKDYNYDGHEIMAAFARGPALAGIGTQVRIDLGDKHALIPTIRGPGISGKDAFAVYYDWGLIDDHIGIIDVTGDPVFPPTVGWAETDLKIQAMHDPPPPGGVPNLKDKTAADTRYLWATQTSGSLWVGANDKCRPSGDSQDRACGRIIQVQGGVVKTDIDMARFGGDVLYPAPLSDCNDTHVAVAFSMDDGTNPPNAMVAGSTLPVAKHTFTDVDFVGSGSQAFTGNRWGDYEGIAPESDDCNSLWAVSQFGATANDPGQVGTQISQVTFAGPEVDKVAPNVGIPGDTVDVFGRHFAPGAFVAFGAAPASPVQFISGTDLRVKAPPHLPGKVDVTVTTLNGTSAINPADVFTYDAVAYVTDNFSHDLFQLDTGTLTGAPIPLTALNPWGLALSPDDTTAWVASNNDGALAPVDIASKAQEPEIDLGGAPVMPEGLAISPDGSTVYVAETGTDMVAAIDTSSKLTKWSLPVPGSPAHLAVTPDGNQLFVAATNANQVTPIDVSGTIPKPGPPISVSAPSGVAITPDGSTAYVTDLDWQASTNVSHVTPIDTGTHVAGTPIPIVAVDPEYISILATGTAAYVSDTLDGFEIPIALPSQVPGAPIFVGADPRGSASLQDGSELFVAVTGTDKVVVIDTSTNMVVNTANVGFLPYEVAINLHKTPMCPAGGYFPPTLQFSPSPGTAGGLENRIVNVNQCASTGALEPGLIKYKVAAPKGCPPLVMKPQKVTLGPGDNPMITQFVAPSCTGTYIFSAQVFHKVGGKLLSLGVAFANVTLN